MATTTERLSIAQLRQRIIAKEETIRLLTERVKFLKVEISALYIKIKHLEK